HGHYNRRASRRVWAGIAPGHEQTTPIRLNHSIASFLPTRVCKPLSIVMSLRDLPMTPMDFENGRHETLPSSHQEILASLRNRFGRPLYPRRLLRTNCPRFVVD